MTPNKSLITVMDLTETELTLAYCELWDYTFFEFR